MTRLKALPPSVSGGIAVAAAPKYETSPGFVFQVQVARIRVLATRHKFRFQVRRAAFYNGRVT